MTTTTAPARKLSPALAARALELYRAEVARFAEWLAEVAEDRRQGYRAHYCRHGVDLWAHDFDGACWRCESSGYWLDPETARAEAIGEARAEAEAAERCAAEVAEWAAAVGVLRRAAPDSVDLFPVYRAGAEAIAAKYAR